MGVFGATRETRPVVGRLRWIGDPIEPVNRTVQVLVDVSNEGQLFALGSFARLEFEQPRKVLAVPEEAVVDEGTSRWVYVARGEGSFAPVQVQVGVKRGGWWEVSGGLMEGDQVVARGAAILGSMPRPQALAGEGPSAVSELSVAAPGAH